MDYCILLPQKLDYLLKHNMINNEKNRVPWNVIQATFSKGAICHPYTHSSAVKSLIHRKKTYGTGSIPNLVLISQRLNAPFLSSTLFCFCRMSFLIAYCVVFAEKRELIFSPCVLGEVLLMCALGVRMLDHIFTIWRSIVPADTEILMTPLCTTLSLTHASLSQDTSQDVWSLFSQCGGVQRGLSLSIFKNDCS